MTYDELVGQLHELTEAGEAVQWTKAELVTAVLGLVGVTPRQVASDLGYSTSHVRRLRKTYVTFPTPESRWQAPNATFSHHRLCAETDRPTYWLDHCAERDLSTRDLQEAIKAANAGDPIERAYAQAERVIQRMRVTWREADVDLRAHMTPMLRAWWTAEGPGC